jgi:DnaJ-class molecular chaperone
MLGAKVAVPTVHGSVTLTIPKYSNSGKTLRLKGKGIQPAKGGEAGNQYVKLQVVLPPEPDEELEKAVERSAKKHPYTARDGRYKV